jgi:hypothetical protein
MTDMGSLLVLIAAVVLAGVIVSGGMIVKGGGKDEDALERDELEISRGRDPRSLD